MLANSFSLITVFFLLQSAASWLAIVRGDSRVKWLAIVSPILPNIVSNLKRALQRLWGIMLARKLEAIFLMELVVIVEDLQGYLKAGSTVARAVEEIVCSRRWKSSCGEVLADLLLLLKCGSSIREALLECAKKRRSRALERHFVLLLSLLAAAENSGANRVEILKLVLTRIRVSNSMRLKMLADTAQIRLQARIVCWSPALAFLFMLGFSPGNILFLFADWSGLLVLLTMLVMTFLGAFLVRRLASVRI